MEALKGFRFSIQLKFAKTARGIAEYWIIDPEMQQVTLCLWVNGQYEDTVYVGDTLIKSTVVSGFDLSASHILAFGQN